MSRQEFFEKAMTDLDEKYISEAAEELYKLTKQKRKKTK